MDSEFAMIANVQRFSLDDGPGIRTTVFFKGCGLRCRWCHNPECIEAGFQLQFNRALCTGCGRCLPVCPERAPVIGQTGRLERRAERCRHCGACGAACPSGAVSLAGERMPLASLLSLVVKDKDFYGRSGGGVTLSGGEPLLQAAFCAAFLAELRDSGISSAIDTSGHAPWRAFEMVLPYAPLFLFDLKTGDPDMHRSFTGASNETILENYAGLCESNADLWVRIPLLGGVNDSEKDIEWFLLMLRGKKCIRRVDLLPYHNYGLAKRSMLSMPADDCDFTPPEPSRLEAIRNRFVREGINARLA